MHACCAHKVKQRAHSGGFVIAPQEHSLSMPSVSAEEHLACRLLTVIVTTSVLCQPEGPQSQGLCGWPASDSWNLRGWWSCRLAPPDAKAWSVNPMVVFGADHLVQVTVCKNNLVFKHKKFHCLENGIYLQEGITYMTDLPWVSQGCKGL